MQSARQNFPKSVKIAQNKKLYYRCIKPDRLKKTPVHKNSRKRLVFLKIQKINNYLPSIINKAHVITTEFVHHFRGNTKNNH